MLHMATESEVIQKIRYQVDNYDEQQEFSQGSELSQVEPELQQHIKLCAPNTSCTTIAAYSIILHQRHEITDVFEPLSSFLEQNHLSSDVNSYKVCLSSRCFFICWLARLHLFHHAESLMTAKKLDQSVQIFSGWQTPGNMRALGMIVSLFKDGQSQVFSLLGYLAFSLFHFVAKPMTWPFYNHLSKGTETKSLDILSLRRAQGKSMNSVLLRALFMQCILSLQPSQTAGLLFRIW